MWRDSTQPYGSLNTLPAEAYSRIGMKGYELTNHLGNVQVVVSDKRYQKLDEVTKQPVGGYLPALAAAYDYYPFGMLMPGRYVADNSVQSAWVNQIVKVPVATETFLQPVTAGWTAWLSYFGPFSHPAPVSSNGGGGSLTGFRANLITREILVQEECFLMMTYGRRCGWSGTGL